MKIRKGSFRIRKVGHSGTIRRNAKEGEGKSAQVATHRGSETTCSKCDCCVNSFDISINLGVTDYTDSSKKRTFLTPHLRRVRYDSRSPPPSANMWHSL